MYFNQENENYSSITPSGPENDIEMQSESSSDKDIMDEEFYENVESPMMCESNDEQLSNFKYEVCITYMNIICFHYWCLN